MTSQGNWISNLWSLNWKAYRESFSKKESYSTRPSLTNQIARKWARICNTRPEKSLSAIYLENSIFIGRQLTNGLRDESTSNSKLRHRNTCQLGCLWKLSSFCLFNWVDIPASKILLYEKENQTVGLADPNSPRWTPMNFKDSFRRPSTDRENWVWNFD